MENVFKVKYGELSDKEKRALRDKFLIESGISYTAFYHKLRNNGFALLEKKCIAEILGRDKNELFGDKNY